MRNKENIQELLNYIQGTEDQNPDFDEEAIIAEYEKNSDEQSLAIKILSVLGGILASLAFIGFLFVAGLYNSETGLLFFGAICIVGAIWINKVYDKIIIDTISVSFFAIGFVLIGFGLAQMETDLDAISLIFIFISCCSLAIVQNYILSFISVLIINSSILTLIISNKAHELINIYISALALLLTYCFLNEAKIISGGKILSKLYDPLRAGLIFSFLFLLAFLNMGYSFNIFPNHIWISSVVIILAIVYLTSILLSLLNISSVKHKIMVYIFTIILLFPFVYTPSIPGAILLILLSFFVNHKAGLGLGILAFLYFISRYYYDLNMTLLTKSLLLFSSGVLFIGLYLFTNKRLSSNEKV